MRRSRALIASSLTLSVALALGVFGAPPATASGAGDKVVIEVWLAEYPFPGYLDERKRQAEQFNAAHPRYQINITGVEFSSLPQAVHDAAMQGNPPDVANYYYNATQLARDARARDGRPLFTSVERAIDDRRSILGEPVVLHDVVSAARNYYSYGWDSTSMPATMNTQLIYANTTIMQAAGITSIPRTWQQLDAACQRIAALPNGPTHCITWPNHSWFFQQAMAQQGSPYADRDNGRSGRAENVNFSSPAMMAYVNWWQRLHADGHYLYTGTPNDFFGNYVAFASQQVAFTLSTADQAGGLEQTGRDAGFAVAAGRLPYNGATGPIGTIISGDSLWLTAGLGRVKEDGALAFMQYLLNPANAASWHRASNYLPMTQASMDLLHREGWFEQHPAVQIAMNQLATASGQPRALGALLGDFDGVQNALTDAMHDVFTTGTTTSARFGQADAAAEAMLDGYNAQCLRSGPRPANCLRVGAWG